MEAGPLLRSCWLYRPHLWHAGGSCVFSGDPGGQRQVLAFQPNIRGQPITQKLLGLQTSSLAWGFGRGLSCVQWRPWSFRTHRGQRPVLAFQLFQVVGSTDLILGMQGLSCVQNTQRSEASFSSPAQYQRQAHYSEVGGSTDLIFGKQAAQMCSVKTLEFQNTQRSKASFSFPAQIKQNKPIWLISRI